MERPKVGVGVVVIKDGKILMGKRKGAHGAGQFCVPGGHLEGGETVEDCAKRELMEETNLHALHLELGPWTENVLEGDKHYVTLFVFVHRFEGELQLLEPHKCEGWEWFSLDQLPSPLFETVESLTSKMNIPKKPSSPKNDELSKRVYRAHLELLEKEKRKE